MKCWVRVPAALVVMNSARSGTLADNQEIAVSTAVAGTGGARRQAMVLDSRIAGPEVIDVLKIGLHLTEDDPVQSFAVINAPLVREPRYSFLA
jgi:hypothetical protein